MNTALAAFNWGVSYLDSILSLRQDTVSKQPKCPTDTSLAGEVYDQKSGYYSKLCLHPLHIEDAEDVYIIILLLFGFFITWTLLLLILCKGPKFQACFTQCKQANSNCAEQQEMRLVIQAQQPKQEF